MVRLECANPRLPTQCGGIPGCRGRRPRGARARGKGARGEMGHKAAQAVVGGGQPAPTNGSTPGRDVRGGRDLRRVLVVGDLVVLALAVAGALAITGISDGAQFRGAPMLVVGVTAGVIVLCSQHLYRARVAAVRSVEIVGLMRTAMIVAASGFLVARTHGAEESLRYALVVGFLTFAGLLAFRWTYQAWLTNARAHGKYLRRVVIVGDNHEGRELAALLADHAGARSAGGGCRAVVAPPAPTLAQLAVHRRPGRDRRLPPRRRRQRRGDRGHGAPGRRVQPGGPRPSRRGYPRALLARSARYQHRPRSSAPLCTRAPFLPGARLAVAAADPDQAGDRHRRLGRLPGAVLAPHDPGGDRDQARRPRPDLLPATARRSRGHDVRDGEVPQHDAGRRRSPSDNRVAERAIGWAALQARS